VTASLGEVLQPDVEREEPEEPRSADHGRLPAPLSQELSPIDVSRSGGGSVCKSFNEASAIWT
jgi:hypothetical protein